MEMLLGGTVHLIFASDAFRVCHYAIFDRISCTIKEIAEKEVEEEKGMVPYVGYYCIYDRYGAFKGHILRKGMKVALADPLDKILGTDRLIRVDHVHANCKAMSVDEVYFPERTNSMSALQGKRPGYYLMYNEKGEYQGFCHVVDLEC